MPTGRTEGTGRARVRPRGSAEVGTGAATCRRGPAPWATGVPVRGAEARGVGAKGGRRRRPGVRGPGRSGQADPRRLRGKQRPERGPRRLRRRRRRIGAAQGAKARPPATHQDAFEEVALLRGQLHARHRGWALRFAGWTRGRAAAESRCGGRVSSSAWRWGLGGLGGALAPGLAMEKENAASTGPGEGRAARLPRGKMAAGPAPSRGRCAHARGAGLRGAGRRGGRCWGGELSGVTWRGRGGGCGSCTVAPCKSLVWCYV